MGLEKVDAMPEVARSLAAEGRMLCFDEFQVGDGRTRPTLGCVIWVRSSADLSRLQILSRL